jgi:hypothetical protein
MWSHAGRERRVDQAAASAPAALNGGAGASVTVAAALRV